MPKPTLTEHRAQVRALLAALANPTYDDAEIDHALRTALSALAAWTPITRAITMTTTANQTVLELANECPAESVTEVVGPNNQIVTEFRARGTQLVLRQALTTAGTTTVFFRSAPTIGPGDATDWYPPQYRAAVCLYAAGVLAAGRAAELAETDAAKAAQISYVAMNYMRDAMTLFTGRLPQR